MCIIWVWWLRQLHKLIRNSAYNAYYSTTLWCIQIKIWYAWKKYNRNTHRIAFTFYSVALQWIAWKFSFINITLFHAQCSYFYTILKILLCHNATGWTLRRTLFSDLYWVTIYFYLHMHARPSFAHHLQAAKMAFSRASAQNNGPWL